MARMTTCPDCGAQVSRKAGSCPKCGRPLKGPGLVSRVARLGCLAFIGLLALGVVGSLLRSPAPRPLPTPAPPRPAAPLVPAPAAGRFHPGDQVEIVGPETGGLAFLANSEAIFEERLTVRRRYEPGKEIFASGASELAEVLESRPDRLHVRMLDGNWRGREGWIAPGQARPRPASEEMASDVVEGLTQDKRREIYGELHRVGVLASYEAAHRFGDDDFTPEGMARRRAFYEGRVKEGRRGLVAKYKVDGAQLDRIDAEGTAQRWPLPDVPNPYRK